MICFFFSRVVKQNQVYVQYMNSATYFSLFLGINFLPPVKGLTQVRHAFKRKLVESVESQDSKGFSHY